MGVQLGPPTHTLFSHVQSPEHVPQSSVVPQPLPISPQYWPPTGSHVTGVQLPPSGMVVGSITPVPALPPVATTPPIPLVDPPVPPDPPMSVEPVPPSERPSPRLLLEPPALHAAAMTTDPPRTK